MRVSHNEVEALAMKAARGAGFPWGDCEEIAAAARWMAEQGLDVARGLCALLADPNRQERSSCPVAAGIAWSDGAISASPVARWQKLRHPVWLVAMIGAALRHKPQHAEIAWPGWRIVIHGRGWRASSDFGALVDVRTASDIEVTLRPGILAGAGEMSSASGGLGVSPADWSALERLAARTHVPESLASRETGAGAGTNDND
jgi:hypothetical protein